MPIGVDATVAGVALSDGPTSPGAGIVTRILRRSLSSLTISPCFHDAFLLPRKFWSFVQTLSPTLYLLASRLFGTAAWVSERVETPTFLASGCGCSSAIVSPPNNTLPLDLLGEKVEVLVFRSLRRKGDKRGLPNLNFFFLCCLLGVISSSVPLGGVLGFDVLVLALPFAIVLVQKTTTKFVATPRVASTTANSINNKIRTKRGRMVPDTSGAVRAEGRVKGSILSERARRGLSWALREDGE
mmetsp:Transcript_10660/g.23096  ORF Transcript_10660/g.23096 Transcript_10660/m.23096 type:complete len:242 (-) Transcript_10660:55-780(-)